MKVKLKQVAISQCSDEKTVKDKTCFLCGEPFKKGDTIIVYEYSEGKRFSHDRCSIQVEFY